MRVVVVGATGNIGTAVLRRLLDGEEFDQVTGIARRLPRRAPGRRTTGSAGTPSTWARPARPPS
ncbi:hypothetical protein ACFQY4_30645 [Catellatospora bangladeshensis]|uniref:hypothetical protein n=1 Tax=Catellatospora bangladeshensis TaxID=310355 RepID=UPI00360B8CAB